MSLQHMYGPGVAFSIDKDGFYCNPHCANCGGSGIHYHTPTLYHRKQGYDWTCTPCYSCRGSGKPASVWQAIMAGIVH